MPRPTPPVRPVLLIDNILHWRCSHCKQWLSRVQFAENNKATHKLQSRCISCSRQMSEARLLAKKEASIAKEKQRFQSALERQRQRAAEYRERKAKGLAA